MKTTNVKFGNKVGKDDVSQSPLFSIKPIIKFLNSCNLVKKLINTNILGQPSQRYINYHNGLVKLVFYNKGLLYNTAITTSDNKQNCTTTTYHISFCVFPFDNRSLTFWQPNCPKSRPLADFMNSLILTILQPFEKNSILFQMKISYSTTITKHGNYKQKHLWYCAA